MLRGKKEKEKLVIKLANEGKTTREIAKEVHVSIKTIGQILNKATGDDKDEQKQKLDSKSGYARAFQMFKDGQPLEDVAIELDIESPTVKCYYEDYLTLVNMGRLVTIYKDIKGDLDLFLRLYGRIKKEGLSKPQIAELLIKQNWPYLDCSIKEIRRVLDYDQNLFYSSLLRPPSSTISP